MSSVGQKGINFNQWPGISLCSLYGLSLLRRPHSLVSYSPLSKDSCFNVNSPNSLFPGWYLVWGHSGAGDGGCEGISRVCLPRWARECAASQYFGGQVQSLMSAIPNYSSTFSNFFSVTNSTTFNTDISRSPANLKTVQKHFLFRLNLSNKRKVF